MKEILIKFESEEDYYKFIKDVVSPTVAEDKANFTNDVFTVKPIVDEEIQ
jgi:hypothetical protein